jgi:hypothetical protein
MKRKVAAEIERELVEIDGGPLDALAAPESPAEAAPTPLPQPVSRQVQRVRLAVAGLRGRRVPALRRMLPPPRQMLPPELPATVRGTTIRLHARDESRPPTLRARAAQVELGGEASTGDSTRDAVRRRIAVVLTGPTGAEPSSGDFEDVVERAASLGMSREGAVRLAAEIEASLAASEPPGTPSYSRAVVDIVSNLSRESQLRERVSSGLLSPEELVALPLTDMLSDAERAERARIRRQQARPADSFEDAVRMDTACKFCGARAVRAIETQRRDIRKSEIWGSSNGEAGSRKCLCSACGRSWVELD